MPLLPLFRIRPWEAIRKTLDGKPLTKPEIQSLASYDMKTLNERYGRMLANKYGNVYTRLLMSAQSDTERAIIWKMMSDKNKSNQSVIKE